LRHWELLILDLTSYLSLWPFSTSFSEDFIERRESLSDIAYDANNGRVQPGDRRQTGQFSESHALWDQKR
jgi:hypothetical protein